MQTSSVSQSAKLIQIIQKNEIASMELVRRKTATRNANITKQDNDYLLNKALSNQVFDIVNQSDMKNMVSGGYKNKRRYKATNKAAQSSKLMKRRTPIPSSLKLVASIIHAPSKNQPGILSPRQKETDQYYNKQNYDSLKGLPSS